MDALDIMFTSFSHSAYRIETLAQYQIFDTNEYEEFKKYISNEKIEGYSNQAWIDDITNWKREGKIIERIRVIPKDTTPYFDYETKFCYPKNIKAGEIIEFVEYEKYAELSKKFGINCDYWLFDNLNVITMQYGDNGDYLGCKSIDSSLVENYIKLFHELKNK